MECPRCGARIPPEMEDACLVCEGVEYDLDQAHALLDRILMYWMYGDGDLAKLQYDTEAWLRVAGPPKS